MLPFTLIGSDQEIVENTRRKRGRLYPWGFVDGTEGIIPLIIVDNPKHCDFTKLRTFFQSNSIPHLDKFSSHLQELKDLTGMVLYENYRTEKLSEM